MVTVENITYTSSGTAIKVPDPTAAETEWITACDSVVKVMNGGNSLAFNTVDFVDTAKATGIEESAFMLMNGRQKAAYLEWKEGKSKPRDWNWDTVKPVTNKKDWSAKTAALKRIYKRDSLTPEQTKAWVLGNWDMHALWAAVILMVRAERAACGGHEDKDPLKFVEAVACRKLLKRLSMHTYKKEYVTGKPTDVFANCKTVLENRLKAVNGE